MTPETIAQVAIDRAGLDELGNTPIDDVLAVIEAETPDYRQLYYRWEREQWQAGTIDFDEDRRQWTEADFSDGQRRSFLWCLSSFYAGEEQATGALVPFVDAAPTEEQQVFLTTQLVDEARHMVFFDRFYDEVLYEGADGMRSRLDRQSERLNPGFRTLLLEMLPEAAAEIRRAPEDVTKLVEGVVLYHVIVEGSLALTGQRFLLDYLRKEDLLPGFRRGFTGVARDVSRHVAFGVRFLMEMVARDPATADVIRDAVARIAPIGRTVMEPPGGDMSYYDPLPYTPEELNAFAVKTLNERLNVIGVSLEDAFG